MNYEAKKPLGLKWKEAKTDGERGWNSQRKIIEYFNKGLEQQHTRSMDTYADARVCVHRTVVGDKALLMIRLSSAEWYEDLKLKLTAIRVRKYEMVNMQTKHATCKWNWRFKMQLLMQFQFQLPRHRRCTFVQFCTGPYIIYAAYKRDSCRYHYDASCRNACIVECLMLNPSKLMQLSFVAVRRLCKELFWYMPPQSGMINIKIEVHYNQNCRGFKAHRHTHTNSKW